MKIIQLKSENIKKLKAVELTFDPKENVVVVSGKNGQGKTSLLDSIWYALGGKDVVPSKPIREGADKASITVDLGDYVVSRTFTEKGSYLTVESKDGAKYPSPQAMLDQLVGTLSFDPLAFAKQDAKRQRQTLLDMLGISVDTLDAERKTLYDERTFVGRELKQLEGQLAGIPKPDPNAPKEEVKVSELADQLAQAKDAQRFNAQQRALLLQAQEQIARLQQEAKELESAIKAYEPVDIPALESQLAEAEQVNEQVRNARAYTEVMEAGKAKKQEYETLTVKIDAIDAKKSEMLAKANMPIAGLGINEDGVTYTGIPFDQISSAEQLKVSLAIAMAANPQIRVIRIMDGSLLDGDNFKVIQEMADAKDYQVFVEKVDDSGKVGVYIEDGEVKADNRQSA